MKMNFLIWSLLSSIFLYQTAAGQLIIKDTLFLAGENDQFWASSSELEQSGYYNYGKYGAINLGDNNPNTCWAEGTEGDGVGEYIYMSIPKNIQGLKIRNGYQKSTFIHKANNRIKKIKLELLACFMPPDYVTETHTGFIISQTIVTTAKTLDDKMGYQEVLPDFNWNTINNIVADNKLFDKERFILKITIEDIYQGNKWNDACISDIEFIPKEVYEITLDEHGLTKISKNTKDTLFYDPENIYQVIDFTENFEWFIFILMPADIGSSRVETIYKLYNTQNEIFIESIDITQIFGFVEEDGKLYLNGMNNNFDEKNILLEDIKQAIEKERRRNYRK
ncbi:MAG TPA: hypothetical protein VK982_05925 [Bacteroidales bacterium]|nr:hypothetical protein [Bacteroidales bacterium]